MVIARRRDKTEGMVEMDVSEMNIQLFRMINDAGKQYMQLNSYVIFMAAYTVFFLGLAVLTFWFTRSNENRMMVICAAVAFGVAEITGKLAGKIHTNHQPFAELSNVNKLIEKAIDNSFPSDHTILFFSFCTSFWLFQRGWGFLWVILAFLVGVSRIWVGVHYPVDVLAGAVISVLSAVVVYRVVPTLRITLRLLRMYEKGEQVILSPLSKSKEIT